MIVFINSIITPSLYVVFHCANEKAHCDEISRCQEGEESNIIQVVQSNHKENCLICGYEFTVSHLPVNFHITFFQQHYQSLIKPITSFVPAGNIFPNIAPRAPPGTSLFL